MIFFKHRHFDLSFIYIRHYNCSISYLYSWSALKQTHCSTSFAKSKRFNAGDTRYSGLTKTCRALQVLRRFMSLVSGTNITWGTIKAIVIKHCYTGPGPLKQTRILFGLSICPASIYIGPGPLKQTCILLGLSICPASIYIGPGPLKQTCILFGLSICPASIKHCYIGPGPLKQTRILFGLSICQYPSVGQLQAWFQHSVCGFSHTVTTSRHCVKIHWQYNNTHLVFLWQSVNAMW